MNLKTTKLVFALIPLVIVAMGIFIAVKCSDVPSEPSTIHEISQ